MDVFRFHHLSLRDVDADADDETCATTTIMRKRGFSKEKNIVGIFSLAAGETRHWSEKTSWSHFRLGHKIVLQRSDFVLRKKWSFFNFFVNKSFAAFSEKRFLIFRHDEKIWRIVLKNETHSDLAAAKATTSLTYSRLPMRPITSKAEDERQPDSSRFSLRLRISFFNLKWDHKLVLDGLML